MPSTMSGLLALGLVLLQAGSLATPVNTHVKHEQRSTTLRSSPWERKTRIDADSIVPLRIGLIQSNLDAGADHLASIAHHESPLYGKHWSTDDVHDFFAPSQDTVEAVRNWLISSGIPEDDIVHSDNKGWLALDVPASSVNDLFKTDLHEFHHSGSGSVRLGCDEYHVPSHLAEHIDYITPGVKLSSIVRREGGPRRQPTRRTTPTALQTRDETTADAAQSTIPANLRHCADVVTPDCIRALYGIPVPTKSDQKNAPGFFEQGDFYAQEDLDIFFTNYAPSIKNGTAPVKALIDGAVAHGNVEGEADGDLEVAFGLVYPTIPILYQVDDAHYSANEPALFNTFLDALDGSYCNYTAYGVTGDSWKDPKYPDPAAGGYKGKLQCGVYKPATVISISYGEAEIDIPHNYNKRQCNEWMKLSLQGTTIFTASGDYGVAGFPNDPTDNGCLLEEGHHGQDGTVFNPDYLSSCPYITSVGGTWILPHHTVYQPEQAVDDKANNFSGSGGFSNLYPRPSWQDSAVNEYLSKHNPGYKSYVANSKLSNIGEGGGLYNRAGRGFPDVSAVSDNLGLTSNGALSPGIGTSFSSPIWASVISLINTARSDAGKGPVGWINQVLYAHPDALNDIVGGDNPGCGQIGFPAVEGWDPNTGLGTPNYPKLLELFMSLP